jgi:molecular chaperone GrpE
MEKIIKENAEKNKNKQTSMNYQQYEKNIIELKNLLLEKENDVKKNLELAKFLQADLENLKKRHAKEISNVHNYAIKDFAKKLLNVIDSIEQGITHINNNQNIKITDIKQGLDMSYKIFINTIKEFKIKQIECKDKKFDPEKHEAISIVKNNDKENNIIIDTLQKGYLIDNRILRTSKVIVCKNN